MRIYIKFIVSTEQESCTVDIIDGTETFQKVIEEACKTTNLRETDKFKLLFKDAPVPSLSMTLNSLGVVENSTITFLVSKIQGDKVKLKKPRSLGTLGGLSDVGLLGVFLFLEPRELLEVQLVCRKWKTVSYLNEALWRFHCENLFKVDSNFCQYSYEHQHQQGDGETGDVEGGETNASLGVSTVVSGIGNHNKKGNIPRTVLFNEPNAPYLTWYRERLEVKKSYKRVGKFSLSQSSSDGGLHASDFVRPSNISGAILIGVQKKPKPVTEEEEKFLTENDPKEMKKLLRKKKGMKELYKKYKALEKKKQDYEFGNWRAVPEEFQKFDYGTLMNFTTLNRLVSNDGEQGATSDWVCFYDGEGRVIWGSASTKEIKYVGYVQAFNSEFCFHQVEILCPSSGETATASTATAGVGEGGVNERAAMEMKELKGFFDLFAQHCPKGPHNMEIKSLIDVQLGSFEEWPRDIPYKGKLLFNFQEATDIVRSSGPKEAVFNDEDCIFGTNAKLYQMGSSDAAIFGINMENIAMGYAAILRTAALEQDVLEVGIPCLEEQILKQLDSSNAFRALLSKEPLVESFLRAVRQVASEITANNNNNNNNNNYNRNNYSSNSVRGVSKQMKLKRAVILFETETNADESIRYLREVLGGVREEKIPPVVGSSSGTGNELIMLSPRSKAKEEELRLLKSVPSLKGLQTGGGVEDGDTLNIYKKGLTLPEQELLEREQQKKKIEEEQARLQEILQWQKQKEQEKLNKDKPKVELGTDGQPYEFKGQKEPEWMKNLQKKKEQQGDNSSLKKLEAASAESKDSQPEWIKKANVNLALQEHEKQEQEKLRKEDEEKQKILRERLEKEKEKKQSMQNLKSSQAANNASVASPDWLKNLKKKDTNNNIIVHHNTAADEGKPQPEFLSKVLKKVDKQEQQQEQQEQQQQPEFLQKGLRKVDAASSSHEPNLEINENSSQQEQQQEEQSVATAVVEQ